LGGDSPHRSSSGTHHDTPSSSGAPSAAASVKSESLHGRLVVTHAELIALSESLAVSFNMTDDMEVIYRLSAEMTEILQRLKDNGPCYPPMPIAKCHGMTSLLILGCYSYLLEAYEFSMAKLRHELQDTGSPTAMLQQRQQRDASTEEAPQINIGGIRLQVSRKSAAEIHLQIVSQTAQNLRESLRQFVTHTAAPRCSMDLDTVDDSPASNRTGGRAGEPGRSDTIEILTTMAQRELQRREDGIFQYINESAAKKTR
jgi:acyl-CoA synthetase (AMP-forming)/AMP-acid ligase II